MSRLRWRWEEKDFGFRFRVGSGKRIAEHYQAGVPGDFYVIPVSERKLSKTRADELATRAAAPNVAARRAQSLDGLCPGLGLDRRSGRHPPQLRRVPGSGGVASAAEDEGVARAMEFVSDMLSRPEPAPLTVLLVRQVHRELMGEIYPFAGAWRTVALHKGEGPTKWPMPLGGIEPLMEGFDRDVLSKSPVIADDDTAVIAFAAEVMGELIAIHPFREGNGRAAFILGNPILMQNDLLPLDVYDRRHDQGRYFEACEAVRVKKDYAPMTSIVHEWEDAAIERWEASHGKE